MESTRRFPAEPPLFLVGAGFGRDARGEAGSIRGRSIYIGEYEIECGYPLVSDLPSICFPNASPPVPADEVEGRLASALEAGDSEPLQRLYDELMKADYYLAPRLLGTDLENPYAALLSTFPSSSYVSFNYDSFLELGLFRAGRWSPHDGYGVPVATDVGFTAEAYEVRDSACWVLHLHGSLLVYTQDHTFRDPDASGVRWMERVDPPRFLFDPHSLGGLFYPFTRVVGGLSYNPFVTERVLAPIPDKAKGLRHEFIRSVRAKAVDLLRSHSLVVSIGYSFAASDRASYSELLDAFSSHDRAQAVLVVPEAEDLAHRLGSEYPNIEWIPQSHTFAEWFETGFPGIRWSS